MSESLAAISKAIENTKITREVMTSVPLGTFPILQTSFYLSNGQVLRFYNSPKEMSISIQPEGHEPLKTYTFQPADVEIFQKIFDIAKDKRQADGATSETIEIEVPDITFPAK